MKKLILLSILLIVGCEEYTPTNHTHEKEVSWLIYKQGGSCYVGFSGATTICKTDLVFKKGNTPTLINTILTYEDEWGTHEGNFDVFQNEIIDRIDSLDAIFHHTDNNILYAHNGSNVGLIDSDIQKREEECIGTLDPITSKCWIFKYEYN